MSEFETELQCKDVEYFYACHFLMPLMMIWSLFEEISSFKNFSSTIKTNGNVFFVKQSSQIQISSSFTRYSSGEAKIEEILHKFIPFFLISWESLISEPTLQ